MTQTRRAKRTGERRGLVVRCANASGKPAPRLAECTADTGRGGPAREPKAGDRTGLGANVWQHVPAVAAWRAASVPDSLRRWPFRARVVDVGAVGRLCGADELPIDHVTALLLCVSRAVDDFYVWYTHDASDAERADADARGVRIEQWLRLPNCVPARVGREFCGAALSLNDAERAQCVRALFWDWSWRPSWGRTPPPWVPWRAAVNRATPWPALQQVAWAVLNCDRRGQVAANDAADVDADRLAAHRSAFRDCPWFRPTDPRREYRGALPARAAPLLYVGAGGFPAACRAWEAECSRFAYTLGAAAYPAARAELDDYWRAQRPAAAGPNPVEAWIAAPTAELRRAAELWLDRCLGAVAGVACPQPPPAIDDDPGAWVKTSKLAGVAVVGSGTLRDQRSAGHSYEGGLWGIDSCGRQWRKLVRVGGTAQNAHTRYHVPSLPVAEREQLRARG